jgi:hypothetical protein
MATQNQLDKIPYSDEQMSDARTHPVCTGAYLHTLKRINTLTIPQC